MSDIFPEQPITSLPEAVAFMGALPMKVGTGPQELPAERLAEIAARMQAATAGPWWTDTLAESDGSESIGVGFGDDSWIVPCQDLDPLDAEFIAHARADVPDLLADNARLRAQVAELGHAVQQMVEGLNGHDCPPPDEAPLDTVTRFAVRLMKADRLAAELEALELGDLDGRVSATCAEPGHPTWLRSTTDVRGCPWCRIAELEAERRSTNEALDDAVQELRARQSCPCLPADQPGPHQLGCPLAEVPRPPLKGRARLDASAAVAAEATHWKRLGIEDPHDGPLAHSYRVPHDLPEGCRLSEEQVRELGNHFLGGGA